MSDFGLWAQDLSGILQPIALEGDLFEVNDGDFRKITQLYVNLEHGINDFGQIAFSAEFADGTSGVFVSDRVAIPEPDVAYLVFAIFAAALVNRYRTTCDRTKPHPGTVRFAGRAVA